MDIDTSPPHLFGHAFDARLLGRVADGLLACRVDSSPSDQLAVTTATRWFADTDEYWGFENRAFHMRGARRVLAADYVLTCWRSFLWSNDRAESPLDIPRRWSQPPPTPTGIILGVTGLAGSWWQRGFFELGDEKYPALAPAMEFRTAVGGGYDSEPILNEAMNHLRSAYGRLPLTAERFRQLRPREMPYG